MKSTVYIETTIISYLAARPSRNATNAGRQKITRQWWDEQRPQYRLVSSSAVVTEATEGDPLLAAQRLALLDEVEMMEVTGPVLKFAGALATELRLPPRVFTDATHIAAAAFLDASYLLTWNCRHIANLSMYNRIRRHVRLLGWWHRKSVRPSN